MKFNSINQRLTGWFLILTLLPALLLGLTLYQNFKHSLHQTILSNLSGIADKKADQLDAYLNEIKHDVHVKANGLYSSQVLLNFHQAFALYGVNDPRYLELKQAYQPYFQHFVEDGRYYDMLLVSPDGWVVFSHLRESDLGTNLFSGPWRNTGLAQVVRQTQQTLESSVSGLEYYQPSDNRPALFVASPVLENGELKGVLVLQMDVQTMQQILTDNTGLGETGETVVGRRLGGDQALLMAPTKKYPDAMLKQTIDFRVQSNLLARPLNGERGSSLAIDYMGTEVVAAWRYLPQLDWGMVVKMDAKEALAPLYQMQHLLLVMIALLLLFAVVAARVLAKRLTVPLEQLCISSQEIANGQLQQRVAAQGNDELARLAAAFNLMAEQLQQSYDGLEKQVKQRTSELNQSLLALQIKDAALSSSLNPIVILQPDYRISFVNAAFVKLWQLESASLVEGSRLSEWVTLPTDWQATLSHVGRWHGEIDFAGDQTLTLQLSCNLVFDSKQQPCGVLCAFIDITSQKQTEQVLIEARDAAEDISRTKSQFLANMSHEIRTPMNAILGLTQLVLESGLPPHQQDLLSKVHVSAKALLGILNDILDFSKIEANKLDVEHIPFKLEDIMLHLVNLFGANCAQQGLDLFLEISPELPSRVLGDPLRLSQILTNLLSNAIKFTNQGEIYLKVERDVGGKNLVFLVRDSGIGMSERQLQQLFQPFTQSDSSATRQYGGTGLGLSISQRLATLMGGSIKVSSVLGQGSCFSLSLPYEADNTLAADTRYQQLADLRVLVVDDQQTSRLILCRLLAAWQIRVEAVASGSEALNLLSQQEHLGRFDVILIDWLMPEMDGLVLAGRIEQLTRNGQYKAAPRILMVTAHDRELLLSKLAQLPVSQILAKPVIPSHLFNLLLECCYPHASIKVPPPMLAPVKASQLSGIRILLVEDHRINQMMARELLQKRGAVVSLANNGVEALERVKQQPFDVVLMDIHMPVMDGINATRLIRQLPGCEQLPIIAMTAAVMESDRLSCTEAGMVDFIAKPIEVEQVMLCLARYIPQIQLAGAKPTESTLPLLTGLDCRAALARLDGDVVLYRRLLADFMHQYCDCVTQVDDFLSQANREQAVLLLHSLKGAAANLGAGPLSESAGQWEQDLRHNGDNQARVKFLLDLESTLISVGDYLRQVISEPLSAEDSDLLSLLLQLKPYLQQNELIPPELIYSLYQQGGRAELNSLRQQIDNFDTEAALITLEQLLRTLKSS